MHLASDMCLLSNTGQSGHCIDPLLHPQGSSPLKWAAVRLPPKKDLSLCSVLLLHRGWAEALSITQGTSLGIFFMVIGLEWRLYTVVQTKQYSLAQLLPQILCGKGRKDCLYCSDTTWLCALLLFDLLSHSIFSEYCKSPITTTVFQNSTPKPRKSTLSVTTHQTMKYLTSLYKFIRLLHPLKNVFSFFSFFKYCILLQQFLPEPV